MSKKRQTASEVVNEALQAECDEANGWLRALREVQEERAGQELAKDG